MKVVVEIEDYLDDVEIMIKSPVYNEEIDKLRKNIIAMVEKKKIIFYKNNTEYYFELSGILFFETGDNKIYAHAREDVFEVKYKLYELEEMIPSYFMRISKSTIINTREIYSLEKSFSGTSTANFSSSFKKVHVSRNYYKQLKEKLTRGETIWEATEKY